ncbi:MAG: SpoIIE family protein phosphatase [Spirochaetales bacterium]|nr:SpoIIE family protein phosphatase [Spirochaetales bacterium]
MNGFLEVDYYQNCKWGEKIAGDVFLLSGDKQDGRIVCTLSDGLGSGVKANVLATLTATMGQKFTLSKMDIVHSARVIMKTLPVCRERKISYSTFTMVDIDPAGSTSIVEYDNPPFILVRSGEVIQVGKQRIPLEERFPGKTDILDYSTFKLRIEDRLIFFSDGVSQSGIGTSTWPLGWRMDKIKKFILEAISADKKISARSLSRKIVHRALLNDIQQAKDDITCAVIYFRKPRKLLILSGPPIDKQRDSILIEKFRNFSGNKIICGGTTAQIIARGIGEEIDTDLRSRAENIPPCSSMKSAVLVTEGILTLSATAELLDRREETGCGSNAASRLINLLMESDEVHFIVGTKINEAHQDPNIPIEIALRRTIINRIKRILEEKYLKQTFLEYL